MADNLTGTQGHEEEVVNVGGLKATMQKFKTEKLDAGLSGKQDVVNDLTDIRSGASKGATAYQKPSGGIPKSDLASEVQTSLGKADTAIQDVSGKVDKTTTVNGHALNGNVTVSKSDVGLGNVTNDAQVKRSEMGTASGVATLDSAGKVPSSQLPSYVDDVLEYDSRSGFPATGEGGKIYVDKSNNTTWRWSGSAYSQIKGDLVIGTTSGTAADGGTANSHYNNTSNPHNVTKAQVGLGNVANTGDSATPVSGGKTKFTTGGAYTELNKKVDKVSGKGLSTNDYTTDEKNKLGGIASGAEVNQNAFSNVGIKVGNTTTTVAADAKTDTVTLIQGSNVTLTADTTNNTITIAAKDTTYSSKAAASGGSGVSLVTTGEKYTWNNKSNFSGSYNDLTNKPTIPSAANNGTYTVKTLVGSTTTNVSDFTANQSGTDDVTFVQGSNVTITPDATNRKITIAATDTTYSAATTSAAGLMSSDDKTKLNGIATGATKVTTNTVSGWGYTKNAGTVTQVKIGSTAYNPSSGVISLPAYPTDTNTHRPIQVNGTEVLGNNTTALNLKAGTNVSITNSSGTVTITSTDTNTWRPVGTGATDAAAGNHTHSISLAADSGNNQITLAHGTKYKLTAGGKSVIFTTPSDNNTTYSAGSGLSLSGTTFSLALTKALVTTALGYTPPTTDTNTWRTVQCNGTSIGNNTLNLKAGTNVSLSNSNGTITITSTDTNTWPTNTSQLTNNSGFLYASSFYNSNKGTSYDKIAVLDSSNGTGYSTIDNLKNKIGLLNSNTTIKTFESERDGLPVFGFTITNSAGYEAGIGFQYNGNRAYTLTGGTGGTWRQI